jgi:Uma2 family endonuclease
MVALQDNERFFTPEEYFDWEERQLEKHELIDGRVYAMSGGTQNHSKIAVNILVVIRTHLRGSGCKTFNSDCRVNIVGTSNYVHPVDNRQSERDVWSNKHEIWWLLG